jgi:hypothetical protein
MAERPPLSHHDILALAEPFVRQGLQPDLAACDRAGRVLVFRPKVATEGATERATQGAATLWQLEDRGPGPDRIRRYRLTRTLHLPGGLQATLNGTGQDLPALLARLQAVPVARQGSAGPGFVVVRHHTLDADGAAPLLVRGTAQIDAEGGARVMLDLHVPPVRRVAARWVLRPAAGTPRPALPEDLLAVLGWHWARLVPDRDGWTSRLRLRGSLAQRTPQAEAALDRAAAHLAQTLGEAPARYHARWRGARWAVFFRRGIPTFTALALVAAVLLSAAFKFQPSTVQMILLYHLPTLVIALSFVLQELPRFEIPPWPRALRGTQPRDWLAAAAALSQGAGERASRKPTSDAR